MELIWIWLGDTVPPSRRTWDAAVATRFPPLFQALARVVLRLPRGSRARQALLRRSVVQSMGAWSRGDLDLAVTRYAPDALLTVEARIGDMFDLAPAYHGRDGLRAFMRSFQEVFGDRFHEPQWLVDLGGGAFVYLIRHRLLGRASGVEVEMVSAHRVESRKGLVARESLYGAPEHNWETALRAAGLDPARHANRLSSIARP